MSAAKNFGFIENIKNKLKIYFGFSRTTHSFIDIAQPAIGAMIVANGFPELRIIIIGLIAAFAGYTAVFALNDLIDYKVDTKRMKYHQKTDKSFDIDTLGMRHPIAQGQLPYIKAFLWVAFWALIAIVGAYMLSPICALLFIIAGALEIIYCKLLKITPWKTIASGLMVATGALAGIYAITLTPNFLVVIVFFIWMFAWEIGGRNITNDWSDIEEDPHLGIKTVPVVYGLNFAGIMDFFFLILILASSIIIAFLPGVNLGITYLIGAIAIGLYSLILPGINLLKNKKSSDAMKLFNRACFYPTIMLGIVIMGFYVPF